MPTVMLNVSGMRISAEQCREALLEVAEVDVLDDGLTMRKPTKIRTGAVAANGTSARAASRRIATRNRTPATTEVKPGPAAFGHACRALDVARVRADAGRAAGHGADRVDQQDAARCPRDPPVLVDQAGLLADGRRRSHRVEEVRQHELKIVRIAARDRETVKTFVEVELADRARSRASRRTSSAPAGRRSRSAMTVVIAGC